MGVGAGPWYIDDTLTFTVNTHTVTTGAATDADAVPSYRVYEDETGTAILTGNTAKLDDANTTGFYSEQLTLSAANGFEVGKSYSIYVAATVNSVAATQSFNFKVISTLATPTNITAGTITTATNVTTVNGLAANVITAASIATGAIDADAIADNAIDAGAIATGALTAAKFAAGAIDAAALAADAGTEIGTAVWATATRVLTANTNLNDPTAAAIADAVWDEDATAHQTQGTFGQAIGDPAADTNTIYGAVVTGATGATIAADIVSLEAALATDAEIADAVWDELQSGHVTAGSFGEVATEVAAILVDTGTTLDGNITSIKAKTDSLTFTVANQVDSNIQYVNDVAVTGDGQAGTEWGP